ncbi:MAG: respiratory nitrate reductase subunit gamma [Terriglobales bacterium]
MNVTILNLLLFAVLPYMALLIFFLGTIMRYRKAPFTYSSLSSQFMENERHFWGVVAFHYGIIMILFGHLVGLLIPKYILLWNSVPLRLYVLEISALAFALMTLVGLLGTMERRAHFSRTRRVTSIADWLIEILLLVQVIAGIYVAVFHPWGTSWYAASASPYIRSIFRFSPDVAYITTVPWMIKLHLVNGWLIVLLFPFTRLVHVLVAPFPYLWRKPEVVRWYGIRKIPAFMRGRVAATRAR